MPTTARHEYCSKKCHRAVYSKQFAYKVDRDTALAARQQPCGICGSTNRVGIDHDHDTDAVRGVLCNRCNLAVGLLDDDPARCEAAAAYLRRSRGADHVRAV